MTGKLTPRSLRPVTQISPRTFPLRPPPLCPPPATVSVHTLLPRGLSRAQALQQCGWFCKFQTCQTAGRRVPKSSDCGTHPGLGTHSSTGEAGEGPGGQERSACTLRERRPAAPASHVVV